MITRILYNEEKDAYSKVVTHPVQTWEWGDFQESQGHKVYRLGIFDQNKLISGYSLSFHKIPHTPYSIGTILRGPKIEAEMIENVKKIAEKENAIFVKFEPDTIEKTYDQHGQLQKTHSSLPSYPSLLPSPKVAFYPHSYLIDLTLSEDQLLANMHPKTRYNIKVANRYNVKVYEKTDDAAFKTYLDLLFETTKRQAFYLHSRAYHETLWKILKPTGMVHLMFSEYQGQVLSAFMIFVLKDRLFYPYGSSKFEHKEVMAQNLLMWEVIKFGQSLKLKKFDMWGSLGPNAKEGEQGFGFHRFKQGYGGDLVQFTGTYDLVINPKLYQLYNLVDKYRWILLRLKASIFR